MMALCLGFRLNATSVTAIAVSALFSAAANAQVSAPAPAAPSTAPATAGNDESAIREIVVTGSKLGAQNLQKTPIAVSVVDNKLLKEQGLSTVRDIANYVPNLTFTRNTNQAVVYIRGIGTRNADAGSDPSVTQQVDGVYIARPTAQIGDFLDVERIEVLRGPQGTLYGRNAVGGTINIISTQPSDTFGGLIRVGYGDYNSNTAEAYVTGPIANDTLTASLAGTYREHDAYFDNVVPGKHGVGSADRAGVRGQLRWAPTSDLNVTLRGDYSRIHDYLEGYDHLLAAPPFPTQYAGSLVGSYRDVALNTDQPLHEKTGGVSMDVNYKLGDGFSLKSITAWRKLYSFLQNDNDATDVNAQMLTVREREQQVTQELDLNYTSDRFKAVGGLFFFGDKDFQETHAVIPPSPATPPFAASSPDAKPTVRTRSYAAFTQGSYELVDGLHLIAGLRYTYETKSIDQDFTRLSLNPATPGVSSPGFPVIFRDKRKDHAFTPKFGIDYQVNPAAMVYASATRGFKSGGFNNAATSAATAGFDPEKLWAYEIGTKTQFFDRKLQINLSGFLYDYKDLQVRDLIGPGNATIVNAASARIKGVELETILKPMRALQFSANGAFLDARYRHFPTASVAGAYMNYIPDKTCTGAGATLACTVDASGNRLESTPRWSGVVAMDVTPPLFIDHPIDLHVDYAWRGKTYFDASNIAISSQKAYGLVNANVGVGLSKAVKLEVFIKNAANKKYYEVISGSGIVPGAIVGDPRTYGARLAYTF